MRPALLPLLAACFAGVAAAQSKPVVDPAAAAARIVEDTNAFRRSEGLQDVRVDAKLTRAADDFARYMAKTGKYGHEADGRDPTQRAEAQGYAYCLVLENIAYHYDSRGFETGRFAQAAVEGWKRSAPHRKNMLSANATQTGVGVAQAANGYYYSVQMFGSPRSAAVKFEVRNESRTAVHYRVGDTAYSAPPRSYRTHETCQRETLRFEGPGAHEATPRDGDRFLVPAAGGEVILQRHGVSK